MAGMHGSPGVIHVCIVCCLTAGCVFAVPFVAMCKSVAGCDCPVINIPTRLSACPQVRVCVCVDDGWIDDPCFSKAQSHGHVLILTLPRLTMSEAGYAFALAGLCDALMHTHEG